jgi:hypothetical protein
VAFPRLDRGPFSLGCMTRDTEAAGPLRSVRSSSHVREVSRVRGSKTRTEDILQISQYRSKTASTAAGDWGSCGVSTPRRQWRRGGTDRNFANVAEAKARGTRRLRRSGTGPTPTASRWRGRWPLPRRAGTGRVCPAGACTPASWASWRSCRPTFPEHKRPLSRGRRQSVRLPPIDSSPV